jgi:acetyl-CoA acetyltransferase
MLHATLRTLAKVVVASLVVGTILAHFGITAEQLMREVGLSAERVEDYARKGFAWAWPNVLLGALVIVPIWFLLYLLRPPGQSRSE